MLEGQQRCRMPFNLGLSDVFLLLRLGLSIFRETITEAKSSAHVPRQVVHDICVTPLMMLALIVRTRWYLLGLSRVK